MPIKPTGGALDLSKMVEKQMRNWEIARSQCFHPEPDEPEPAPDGAEFVTVSRELGAGGATLANLLGERLGWPVFDREILQFMAGDDRLRARIYEKMDERDMGWLEHAIRWIVSGEQRKDDYFCRLTETVLTLNHQGPAVFLGRGIDLILPHNRGLRVRLIASIKKRVEFLAMRREISEDESRTVIERVDQERQDYIRRYFNREDGDPTRYDITFNMDFNAIEHAVELIINLLRLRGVIA